MTQQHPLMNIAIKAALNASKLILRASDRPHTIKIMEKITDEKQLSLVTDIDQLAEREIIKTIHEAYPDHAILGEESGHNQNAKSDYVWVIDPIDGTYNFIHGNPNFSISIAIMHKNKVEHGLIYDPLRQEMYTATLGSGAFLNERRIRIPRKQHLIGATIGIGFGNSLAEHQQLYLQSITKILANQAEIRASGSSALDCVYVAIGRLDGFIGIKLSAWDIAAASLIIQEAGGMVSDFSGGNNFVTSGNIITSSPAIIKELWQIVK